METFIKSNGKIIIGTLIAAEEELPTELVEFDGNNLHTEWDKYFTWSSRRIVKDYLSAKMDEEKGKQKEWLYKWYKMYAQYRIKYEKWCLFAIEKIN